MSQPEAKPAVSAYHVNSECDIAIATLRTRLRDIAREHSDRIKRLETIKKSALVHIQNSMDGDNELSIGGFSLSPDAKRLLANPSEGL